MQPNWLSQSRVLRTCRLGLQTLPGAMASALWCQRLISTRQRPGSPISPRRQEVNDERRILFIEHSVPAANQEAGAVTIHHFAEVFSQNGWIVVLACLGGGGGHSLWQFQTGEFIPLETLPPIRGFQGWWQRYGHHFESVLVSRPGIGGVVRRAMAGDRPKRLIFYGHDLHAERLNQEATITSKREIRLLAQRFQQLERSLWRWADGSLYPSRQEAHNATALEPQARIRAVTPYVLKKAPSEWHEPPRAPRLLFVGNFRHEPNIDGIRWFCEAIWPRLQAMNAQAICSVAGAAMPKSLRDVLAGTAGIHVAGWLSSQDLMQEYRQARIIITPLRYGAGIKHKVVEALAHFRPVVTTSIGLQGLEGLGTHLPANNEAEDFAKACQALLTDDALWQERARQGQSAVLDQFSAAAMWSAFAAELPPEPTFPANPAQIS